MPAGDALSAPAILAAAGAVAAQPGALLVSDDPLRRSDVWELLPALAELRPEPLGVCTFGHGLTSTVAGRLGAAGVRRVHVPFHSARQDAHDWLSGRSGALKMAHHAIRACLEADLSVVAEIVLTRPTMPHLAETVEVLARLGVRAMCVRRLTAEDTDGADFVPLSPRLSLLQESLEHAAAVALARRVRLRLRDLPLCVAPRLRPLFAPADTELWVLPDGTVRTRGEAGPGCAACPGPPRCAGAPADYLARFGWEEFADRSAEPRVGETVADQQQGGASAPITFRWRGPTRLRCAACADGAAAHGLPPYESTRVIRARLVEAARYRPSVLRLVGADLLAHPQAAALIHDALRLFRHVEVAGEASAVKDWSDLDLRRMKELRRFDVALYGPDAAAHDAHCGIPGAFAAMQRGVERVRRHTDIPVGAYAVVHDAGAAAAFAEAWSRGALPGAPRFRLSASGASLDELAACARALPPGPARAALVSVLPRCLCEREGLAAEIDGRVALAGAPQRHIECGRPLAYQPCGSDPVGAFETCQDGTTCTRSGCPGTAVGWHSTARSERWSESSS